MNRKERRNIKKQGGFVEKPITYNVKKELLDEKLEEAYMKGWNDALKKFTSDETVKVMTILFGLPCKVLKEKFGFGNKKKLPEFAEALLQLYQDFSETPDSLEELQEQIFQDTGMKFIFNDEE